MAPQITILYLLIQISNNTRIKKPSILGKKKLCHSSGYSERVFWLIVSLQLLTKIGYCLYYRTFNQNIVTVPICYKILQKKSPE